VGTVGAIVTLLTAIAKAWPYFARVLDGVRDSRIANDQRELHHAIEDGIARARSEAAACPYALCPMRDVHRWMRDRDGAQPGPGAPGSPGVSDGGTDGAQLHGGGA